MTVWKLARWLLVRIPRSWRLDILRAAAWPEFDVREMSLSHDDRGVLCVRYYDVPSGQCPSNEDKDPYENQMRHGSGPAVRFNLPSDALKAWKESSGPPFYLSRRDQNWILGSWIVTVVIAVGLVSVALWVSR